jgi:hypothetical protein
MYANPKWNVGGGLVSTKLKCPLYHVGIPMKLECNASYEAKVKYHVVECKCDNALKHVG